ncbi:hypothetical protein ACFE04_022831 [Oxalis oulophora]
MDINGDKASALSRKHIVGMIGLIVGLIVSYCAVFTSAYSQYSFSFFPISSFSSANSSSSSCTCNSTSNSLTKYSNLSTNELELYKVLEKAANKDNTVIITNVNDAWAEPNSLLDVLMDSIRTGNGTQQYLGNLVVVCVDHKAYNRCLTVHPHCYKLNITQDNIDDTKEAYFMTPKYMMIVWKKIEFLTNVLELGFNFVFTDCDIVWLQDPFPVFFPEADIQSSCDNFQGDSYSASNWPNTGFHYVKSNERTITFYRFWHSTRSLYPRKHDQDVFNYARIHPFIIASGIKIMFLDPKYIGGFCQHGDEIILTRTMHANCCFGLGSKIHDLKVVLEDWRNVSSLPSNDTLGHPWRVPIQCR